MGFDRREFDELNLSTRGLPTSRPGTGYRQRSNLGDEMVVRRLHGGDDKVLLEVSVSIEACMK
jgi:hypothetical protein